MKRILILAVTIWVLAAAVTMPANAAAADAAAAGTVLKTDVDTEVYRDASEASGVAAVLEAGTVLLVTEEAKEGWCRISSREVTGYIKTAYLAPLISSDEMELEFEQIGNNYHMLFNEVQQVEQQQSQTKIWGIIIALLTVGVFASGIVPVIKKNREDEKNRIHAETKR